MPSANLNETVNVGVRELRQLDARTEERLRDLGASLMPLQRLKRTGAAPLLFNGVTMAMVCGVTPALPFWYELNLHRTVIGTFVTDVRLFHNSGDLQDLFRVKEHDDVETAIAHLESYHPDNDAALPLELVLPAQSAAALALGSARLQMQLDQLRGHYRALLGDLLHALTPTEA